MRIQAISAVIALTAATAFADASLSQKTQIHFNGAMGGIMNRFGGNATREGIVNTTAVKGNRKMTRTEDHGELIDLDAEKIYMIDFARKTYTVMTFDEMRKRFEEGQERMKKSSERHASKDEQKGPEWEFEFHIKATGKTETINGWNTREQVATVITHEKGKTLEQSGGFVLTSDMWMGPHIPAMKEVADFDRRYISKLYGSSFDAEMVKMAAAMAMQPALGKAMKELGAHRGSFEGTPIRTTTTFETVPGPATQQQAESNDSAPTSPGAALLGGLMKRRQSKQSEDGGHSSMFDSVSELMKATLTASTADVTIPADFKQK
jgi:hypothetical protein